ncbi:MAG: hypothetical protein JWO46_1005 [Nocardioidaceae bacterium]|nr:hypothetical protein [Nocardioidaceae bacterium]
MAKKIDEPAAPSSKRRNRQLEMQQAALEIFARKGYDAASIQDVADAIGVLKGSVYHYISSKEDLLFTIFDDAHHESVALMEQVTALDMSAEEKLQFYLERSIQTTLENIERTTLYLRDWRSLTGDRLETVIGQRREYDVFLRRLINEAYESLGVEPTMSVKYASSFVSGGANWVADWYRTGGPDSADKVAKSYAQLAIAAIMGVATPSPQR